MLSDEGEGGSDSDGAEGDRGCHEGAEQHLKKAIAGQVQLQAATFAFAGREKVPFPLGGHGLTCPTEIGRWCAGVGLNKDANARGAWGGGGAFGVVSQRHQRGKV